MLEDLQIRNYSPTTIRGSRPPTGTSTGQRLRGGANNGGTIFKITPSGTLTTLYSFCPQSGCTDGEYPYAGLVQATNGDFYGTTDSGGGDGYGTVFKITPSGTLTTLHSFCSQGVYPDCTDGEYPEAPLVQATNGDLYGTASSGGASGNGTVFKITPSGTLTTLHTFAGYPTDGSYSTAGLVQATNGDLYGTAEYGGVNCGDIGGCGTVFKITPGSTLTTLYSFCSQGGIDCTDGDSPDGGLVQATDGNFYGTTQEGVANGTTIGGCGTIFKITPSATLTTLYSFCSQPNCTDGNSPYTGLVQATNGHFYGTTGYGGTSSACNNGSGCGTVFGLSVGLGPFVETQTTSGEVGEVVRILGTDLTGATSGKVQVVTPSGTLSSNVPFRVLP
jgi:uncharacterized repeat protein (TIGR03803 family)